MQVLSECLDPDISRPFPVEFLIRDTPRSHQSRNAKGKELWKRRIGEVARAHVSAASDFLDPRPLAATIFYFPVIEMQGDVDNIVKLIIDGMLSVIYPDDRLIERVVVQKFELGVEAVFQSLTPTLEQAIGTERSIIYIRIDDDLSWKQVP